MIITRARIVSAAVAVLALLASGCSAVTGNAVGRHDMTAAGNDCTEVEAPMTPISAEANEEPRLRIPQPAGWEVVTAVDAETARFQMENPQLTDDDFAWVMVGLESQPGHDDPAMVIDAIREGMLSEAEATDVTVTDGTVCGQPAQTLSYTMTPDELLSIPAPGTSLVVVTHGTNRTYAAIVTILTTNPDAAAYQDAAETILTGFQVLPSVV
jgi:hypothetical protein